MAACRLHRIFGWCVNCTGGPAAPAKRCRWFPLTNRQYAMPFKAGTSAYILHRLKKWNVGIMAKSVRRRGRKGAARKAPITAKRKAAQLGVMPGKIRALVYNLSTQELDELIKVA